MRLGLAILACAFAAAPASARIVRMELTEAGGPAFDGASFGAVGTYSQWTGRVYGEVNPDDKLDAAIVDLKNAPRDAHGMVHYSANVAILRPTDPAHGNHKLLMGVNNRGGVLMFGAMNDAPKNSNDVGAASNVGNGFLMRQGYTMAWSGWDAVSPRSKAVNAAPGAFMLDAPIARGTDGGSIVGPSMEEFVVDDDKTLSGPLTYEAADLDPAHAKLTVRKRTDDEPVVVPADMWAYAADGRSIHMRPDGTPFAKGELYELVYPAKDPVVAGLGFAAIRDVLAYLREAPAPGNPAAGQTREVLTFCISQPCRAMRDFVRLGFNQIDDGQDGKPRRAIDGILDFVGGGSGIDLNYRFAQPFRTSRQHIARHYPEFSFPFAYDETTDSVTGRTDGLLVRCGATDTCPKIIDANSDNEYWSKSGSMLHTDAAGHDLPDVAGVRLYLIASRPHGDGVPPSGKGYCQQERSPLVANQALRALLVDLDEWVSTGEPPPPSMLPRRSNGTLVKPDQADMGFPDIPGVTFGRVSHTGDLFDFGPRAAEGILTTLPPKRLGAPYATLMPKVDADGNTVAGIRLPDIAVPVATYTGWNLRADVQGETCDHFGSVIPFARTKAEREKVGDPRLSLEERYGDHATYVARVGEAAEALVRDRLLLQEDATRDVERAKASDVLR